MTRGTDSMVSMYGDVGGMSRYGDVTSMSPYGDVGSGSRECAPDAWGTSPTRAGGWGGAPSIRSAERVPASGAAGWFDYDWMRDTVTPPENMLSCRVMVAGTASAGISKTTMALTELPGLISVYMDSEFSR